MNGNDPRELWGDYEPGILEKVFRGLGLCVALILELVWRCVLLAVAIIAGLGALGGIIMMIACIPTVFANPIMAIALAIGGYICLHLCLFICALALGALGALSRS